MSDLKHRLGSLAQLIGRNPVSYLDIPVYGNIGDLLIYAGTRAFLHQHSIPVATSAAYFNGRLRQDSATILLQGGGNLGDLYPAHQRFREAIVAANPDKRIIILPQTIHFSTDAALRTTRRVLSQHADLHICVRDEASLHAANGMTSNLILLPDMAHQLYPVLRKAPGIGNGTLGIRRSDIEAPGHECWGQYRCRTQTDWAGVVGPRRGLIIHAARLLARTVLRPVGADAFVAWWERLSDRLVNDSVTLYSSYDRVVTDRLHGHILACLMDIPSVVFDNSYGKNAAYIKAWTAESPLVRLDASSR